MKQILGATVGLLVITCASAQAPIQSELDLHKQTNYLYVPEAMPFVKDEDPMTVHFVIDEKTKEGHVSDDGQVIYIPKGAGPATKQLILESLHKRYERIKK